MKKLIVGALSFSFVLLGAGCSSAPASTSNTTSGSQNKPAPVVTPQVTDTATQPTAEKTFSLDDVAKHGSQADCWTVVKGKVYDVTKAVAGHPGGVDNILKGCGKDGTAIFTGIEGGKGHPVQARDNLENLLVGTLK